MNANANNEYFEKITDENLLNQERNNEVMIISNLKKEFPNGVKAV